MIGCCELCGDYVDGLCMVCPTCIREQDRVMAQYRLCQEALEAARPLLKAYLCLLMDNERRDSAMPEGVLAQIEEALNRQTIGAGSGAVAAPGEQLEPSTPVPDTPDTGDTGA